MFRENCVVTEKGAFVKDLSIFGDRDLKNMAIVDNACFSFAYQLENGVPVIPFYNDKDDMELLELCQFLKQYKERDIRELNKEFFKLDRYGGGRDLSEVVEELFC